MQKEPNLVMTILARDEGDIIKDNIRFHLAHGVDFIVATDNASIDNTRNVFLEYQKKGKLFLIDESGRDKSQATWNNKMAKLAINKFGADYIFHCDADEFWYPKSGNLKNEISMIACDFMIVKVVNVLLESNDGEERFPEDAKYAVVNPIETEDFKEDSKRNNLYFFRYPPKVFLKTDKGLLEVVQGNHSLVNKGLTRKKSSDITIFHFPMRGKSRFFNKIRKTGKAVEKNKFLTEKQSWHIRRWFRAYNNETLDKEYEKLVITKEQASKKIKEGMIKKFCYKDFIKKKLSV